MNVLPLAVCPYANTTALKPSIAAATWLRATALYTGLFSDPARMSSKWKSCAVAVVDLACCGKSLIPFAAPLVVCHADSALDGRILGQNENSFG